MRGRRLQQYLRRDRWRRPKRDRSALYGRLFLLIQLAGTGDELQGIKRGIMEMADGIVINKADGDNMRPCASGAGPVSQRVAAFPSVAIRMVARRCYATPATML